MIYYAVLKGRGEGCDYTVGCNQLYSRLTSTSMDEAKAELDRIIEEYGGVGREEGWNEILLLECSRVVSRVLDKQWSEEK